MIGIIIAMEEERRDLLKFIENKVYKTISGIEIVMGKINNTDCVIGLCGVGKVGAASCTRLLIDLFKPEKIINIGSCGAAKSDLEVGDIVISEGCVQADVDLRPLEYSEGVEYTRGQHFKTGETFFYADKELIGLFKKTASICSFNVFFGNIATQDQFVNSPEFKDSLYIEFGAMCNEMEAGAVAQVCSLQKVPYVVVKVISDKAQHKDELQFYKNISKASQICAEFLRSFIQTYETNNAMKPNINNAMKPNINNTIPANRNIALANEESNQENAKGNHDMAPPAQEKAAYDNTIPMVGIVVALDKEEEAVFEKMTEARRLEIDGESFWMGYIGKTLCVLGMSGVGKVRAANFTQGLMDRFNIVTVINTGTTGTLVERVKIGDVVFATSLVQGDVDLTELNKQEGNNFLSGQLYFKKDPFFTVAPEILLIANEASKNRITVNESGANGTKDNEAIANSFKVNDNVINGTIVSKDQFADVLFPDNISIEKFDGLCEEMEGAAVAQVCSGANIPFVVIRGIANAVGKDAVADYIKYEKIASDKAANYVVDFLKARERFIDK